jgi:hypothetical protein
MLYSRTNPFQVEVRVPLRAPFLKRMTWYRVPGGRFRNPRPSRSLDMRWLPDPATSRSELIAEGEEAHGAVHLKRLRGPLLRMSFRRMSTIPSNHARTREAQKMQPLSTHGGT